MNAIAHSPDNARKTRKIIFQLVLGGLSGAGAMLATLFFLERYEGLLDAPERIFALGVAVVYALMALVVAAGTLAPDFGQHALNVEDRDELTEERSNLLVGAISFLLAAVMVATLALASVDGTPGPIPADVAAIVALVTGLGSVGLAIAYRNAGDEMMRALNKDSTALATSLLFLVFGGWAAAAQLGLIAMFSPLLFVSGLYAIYLLAVFVTVARRGMLKAR